MTQPAPERKPRLHGFPGGLPLPGHKGLSLTRPIARLSPSAQHILPLHQHIGEGARPCVAPGDRVRRGQKIADPGGYISAALHAPTSGNVIAIEDRPVPHPSGLAAPCIVIESDGTDEPAPPLPALSDYTRLPPMTIRTRIREAGIVGLGGACFPTSVKLTPGPDRRIETLVLNGAECEPYIACDEALLRERPDEILEGACIMMHVARTAQCVVALEDRQVEAIEAVRHALRERNDPRLSLTVLPSRYPTGSENQLLYALTGKEVPSDGLPADIGLLCQNVATAASVKRAILDGEPLISRIVTVTGGAIAHPANVEARLGTPFADLVAACGGFGDHPERLLMGGPMMGFECRDTRLPVIKGTNCLLAPLPGELPAQGHETACIRCGECARVCPARLLPQQLWWYAQAGNWEATQRYRLFDCIECGLCAHVCPSSIPLVQSYRHAKGEIRAAELARDRADHARTRHDAHLERIAREKAEREARLRERQTTPA